MSIVIVGGHDRMVRQYKEICKNYRCRAKVFTQMEGDMKDRLGKPDLMVLFTNTVSPKMIITATNEAKRNNTEIVRSHSSSGSALEEILNQYCG